jgi:FlgD Ig-like domain
MKHGISEFSRFAAAIAIAAIALSGSVAARAASPVHFEYANGLSATVFTADDLAARLTTYQGAPAIELPDGRMVPVITDISDPSIYNKGDGRFHPFTPGLVDHVLGSIRHSHMPLDVKLYLLPYPRRGVLTSSTTGNEIFLSPHVLDIEPTVASYVIAHELGHVFHNRFMPSGSSRWREYRGLRGIGDEATYNDLASHAFRPREIFAEDFRVLFGGSEAYFGGHVENPGIAEPGTIAGLEDFYLRVAQGGESRQRIAATNSPNPFNPETEIRVALSPDAYGSDARVSVRVYSVTGALVRELYDGVAAGDFAVRWDGRDSRGAQVASGTYYAQIRTEAERQTLKLVMLK